VRDVPEILAAQHDRANAPVAEGEASRPRTEVDRWRTAAGDGDDSLSRLRLRCGMLIMRSRSCGPNCRRVPLFRAFRAAAAELDAAKAPFTSARLERWGYRLF
jgi:hypothetical protein